LLRGRNKLFRLGFSRSFGFGYSWYLCDFFTDKFITLFTYFCERTDVNMLLLENLFYFHGLIYVIPIYYICVFTEFPINICACSIYVYILHISRAKAESSLRSGHKFPFLAAPAPQHRKYLQKILSCVCELFEPEVRTFIAQRYCTSSSLPIPYCFTSDLLIDNRYCFQCLSSR
jgi:hypothetical protein